ncbi:OmpP1/FadL family transporter [Desulfobulbus oligotrophicus]|uniref:Outer membrane protein transport protein n=1 Tax=Desulfobulbus oligotrophicus TaxID=1909699 RepID=A0A7T6AQ31_9BACT|nr:outer membrane protein transport protein [Desulfobulbus oligotrophicus]QQG65303.1 outer membrane protein transport protein [Desulfobulbus oligotrophicus]
MLFFTSSVHMQLRRFLLFSMALAVLLLETAHASGFRIANQSLGAVGISGAQVASTRGADASYYNPANMSFIPDQWQLETSLTLLHLPKITYTDTRFSTLNGTSDGELFYLPLVHVVTETFDRLRFGFSLTYPYGLSKQWDQMYPQTFAKEFSLLTVEANPTFAVALTDWLSVGGGVRFVHGRGQVKNEVAGGGLPFGMERSSKGTDTALGYNLALSVRPVSEWTMAATYRSRIALNLDGATEMTTSAGMVAPYSGRGDVAINLPAVFSLATAYTWDSLTVEVGWERTFWSSFDDLYFLFHPAVTGTPYAVFDGVLQKDWDDADAYRLGLTYAWNERWTTTLGVSYERTPVPSATLGFELPDADALVYSAGIRFRPSPRFEYGVSYMYYRTRARSIDAVTDGNLSDISGRFTDGGAHALTFGMITTF